MTNRLDRVRISTAPEQDIFLLLVAALALSAGAGGFAGGIYIDLARIGAVSALLIQMIVELRGRRKEFLTSPLFLLSSIGVVFFSALQAIWGYEAPHAKALDYASFIGSRAEATILAFSMAGLMFYLLASRKNQRDAAVIPRIADWIVASLFAVTAAVSFFGVALNTPGILASFIPPFIANASFIIPPLISLSLCLLVRYAQARGRYFRIAVFILAMTALEALVYAHEGKLVMFILVAVSLYTIRLLDFSFSHMVLALLAALLVALVFVQVVQHTRWKVAGGTGRTSSSYFRIFKGKGVWRQTETGYCFSNVLKAHADDPFDLSKQAFWIKGLVPRILWPGKPSLSLGQKYAVNYCSRRQKTLGKHSSSITLLGQPVIQGGIIGLIIHAGLLLFVLAAIERFNANPAALPAAMIAAILPWLIDFDQDFSMYIANAVKFALVMAVLFIPIAAIERRASGAGP
jgi:hypothetical protein